MQEKKREVDERHLQLQNLLYEKDHLQRTIQALRDYPLKELGRIEREEGLPGGIGGRHQGLLSIADHRQNMDLLRVEKETRDQHHRAHLAAQKQKEILAAQLQGLREALGVEIPREIEELDALCLGIKDRMPELPVAALFGGYVLECTIVMASVMYLNGKLFATTTPPQVRPGGRQRLATAPLPPVGPAPRLRASL